MTNRPATKKDIDALKKEGRLVAVALPLVVAAIAVAGGWVTAHKQSAVERELVTLRAQVEASNKVILEKNSTYGRMIAEEEVAFFKTIKSVLDDTDTAFQAECYFARSKKNKKLTDSLEALRKLTTAPPATIDSDVLDSLRKYHTFVLSGWLSFDKPHMDDSKRQSTYEESANTLKSVRQTLSDSSKRITSGK